MEYGTEKRGAALELSGWRPLQYLFERFVNYLRGLTRAVGLACQGSSGQRCLG
jgi:hypothetical protein